MNVKKAKALRKELGIKPNTEREYDLLIIATATGKYLRTRTKIHSEGSPRAYYRKFKNEANGR